MQKLKKPFLIVILLALCGYATYEKMQTLAIVAIILLILVLYIEVVKRFADLLFALASKTRQARIGEVEFNIHDPLKQAIIENIEIDKSWAKAIFAELSSSHIGLLLAISKAGKFKCQNNIKNTLRDLRAKGLLEHNKPSMTDSDTVWLTDFGTELVQIITTSTKK
ncbi:hypothetical protein [Emticicia agri]|uniref:Uncharacterized protein n=1 Tax=Emticicia agri TaxID=2492393 RepID=A0A4Q5M179_9BACT|nr:hypothetical protein [Emticicia agri]RYU96046.1 hypothetical protein EWM59_09110 [Emticicia agri]